METNANISHGFSMGRSKGKLLLWVPSYCSPTAREREPIPPWAGAHRPRVRPAVHSDSCLPEALRMSRGGTSHSMKCPAPARWGQPGCAALLFGSSHPNGWSATSLAQGVSAAAVCEPQLAPWKTQSRNGLQQGRRLIPRCTGCSPAFKSYCCLIFYKKNYDGKYLKLVNPMKDRFIFLIFVCRLQ